VCWAVRQAARKRIGKNSANHHRLFCVFLGALHCARRKTPQNEAIKAFTVASLIGFGLLQRLALQRKADLLFALVGHNLRVCVKNNEAHSLQLMTTPTFGSVKAHVTSSACKASSFSGNTMSNAMWRSPLAAPPSPHCGIPRPVMTLMQRALTTSSICNGASDHAVFWRENGRMMVQS
jgi:hypothetical protein